MRSIRILGLFLALTVTGSTTAAASDIFAVKTALQADTRAQVATITGEPDQALRFSARDLERRFSLPDRMSGLTVTALPASSQGKLVLDGAAVKAYDFLTRDKVDRLCFVPVKGAVKSSVGFLTQNREPVAASLTIQLVKDNPSPPHILGQSVETVQNVAVAGRIEAGDSAAETLRVRLVSQPQKGRVTFQGLSYWYEPYWDEAGGDSFVLCVEDRNYNLSGDVEVAVYIESPAAVVYKDMIGNPSEYAAVKLWEKGVLLGNQVGGNAFFQPQNTLSRGDFLVLTLAAAGIADNLPATVNTKLPNDLAIPGWLKSYVRKALEQDILDPGQPFEFQQVPTRAEAVRMVARAAKITDVKDCALTMPDQQDIPDWALPFYRDLAAYRMLDLHQGYAYPSQPLTNAYAADLAWQLWKKCGS